MDGPVTFGEELIARRRQLRLSQSAAARTAGVDRMTWRAWEKNASTPMDSNYARIEAALEWEAGSVERLLTGQGRPELVPPPRARIERDPLRDQYERDMWAFGEEANHPVHRVWWWIDKHRADVAKVERARKEQGQQDCG